MQAACKPYKVSAVHFETYIQLLVLGVLTAGSALGEVWAQQHHSSGSQLADCNQQPVMHCSTHLVPFRMHKAISCKHLVAAMLGLLCWHCCNAAASEWTMQAAGVTSLQMQLYATNIPKHNTDT